MLFKGIFFYSFEIELLLFLSTTLCSCSEEFSKFHFVFVLVTDTLSFVNFDHISCPSTFRTGESESLVCLCNIAASLFLVHQLISNIAISSLTCRDQSNTLFRIWAPLDSILHKNYEYILVPIFFQISFWLFGCHCIQISVN